MTITDNMALPPLPYPQSPGGDFTAADMLAYARRAVAAAVAAAPQDDSDSVQAEPVAWQWQHDETGRVGFVDLWQVEHGWQANNPRCKLVRPLYAHPPASDALREAARMALAALIHHREQTRPIDRTDDAIGALREALEG